MMGVQSTLPFYVGGILVMIVLTTLGYLEDGRFVSLFLLLLPVSILNFSIQYKNAIYSFLI